MACPGSYYDLLDARNSCSLRSENHDAGSISVHLPSDPAISLGLRIPSYKLVLTQAAPIPFS